MPKRNLKSFPDDGSGQAYQENEAGIAAEETRKRVEASHKQQYKRPKLGDRSRKAYARMLAKEWYQRAKKSNPQRFMEWNRARNHRSFLNNPERKRARNRSYYY